ncbi:hypothetical protein NIES4101_76010 [Calothrix sp. NIES-4101]|nr:hypothetical protein NIES4101_76010 [Calothrix sp. NIES-4101]
MKYLHFTQKINSFLSILSANVINNFCSFLITIFTARFLGPMEFAKFALAVALTTNLASILDLGSSTALIRLYNAAKDDNYKSILINVISNFKLGLCLLMIVLSYPGGQLLIQIFPILKDTGFLVYLVIVSSGLLSMWMTTIAAEQSQKHFRSFQLYTLAYGILRLIVAAIFIIKQQISLATIFTSLYAIPISILMIYKYISKYIFLKSDNNSYIEYIEANNFKILKSIFNYGVWVGIGGFLFSLLYQLPQFVLARTASGSEVGFYGAGFTFLPVFMLTNDSIRTILLPEVSAIQSPEGRQNFQKRLWQISPIFFSLMTTVLVVMSCVQYFLLGQRYQDSILVFLAMGSSTILVMFLGYSNTLIHSLGIPYIDVMVNMTRVIGFILFSFFIPKTAVWMSLCLGGIMIIGELIIYFIIKNRVYKV